MGKIDWTMLRMALQSEGFDEITVENIEEIIKTYHYEDDKYD